MTGEFAEGDADSSTLHTRPRVGAVLLAAGSSSRLGRPKQMVVFEGETLVRRTARLLSAAALAPVVVVLGDAAEPVRAELDGLPVAAVTNAAWPQGMASSLRLGLEAALQHADNLTGILIAVCDQPLLSLEVLLALLRTHERDPEAAVACAYDPVTLGTPCLFPRSWFPGLERLEGDRGARTLLVERATQVRTVPFPGGAVDVDTEDDVAWLNSGL